MKKNELGQIVIEPYELTDLKEICEIVLHVLGDNQDAGYYLGELNDESIDSIHKFIREIKTL